MNLMLMTGKLSNIQDDATVMTEQGAATAEFIEQRWADGEKKEIKYFLSIPKFSRGFAEKCVQKDWKVSIFVTDLTSFTSGEWVELGFMAYGRVLSIQL